MKVQEALAELRKLEKRKFSQSIDLIVNLKGLDLRKDNINAIIKIPHVFKAKKVCAFFTKKSELVDTITPPEFAKFKEKDELKHLVKNYDFFIAVAPLMPSVATAFGKVFGPAGKMPSPQLGIVAVENDAKINEELDKISKSVKIKLKEASIKISIGKENMKDQEITDNLQAIYSGIVAALPVKKDNIRSVLLKLTMSKPIKLEVE
ncbi:MAG: hypothetical protein WCK90_00310 [archaeon]